MRVAEAGDEGWVVGGEVDGEVEEEELADAGVGEDVPGFFALVAGGGGEGVSDYGVFFWFFGFCGGRGFGGELTIAVTCCFT